MKKSLLFVALVCYSLILNAQLRLNVEGDGNIDGQIAVEDRISFPNRSVYIGQNARANGANNLENTFVGYRAGFGTASFGNTFIGAETGSENFLGNDNTFVGRNSGAANTDGDANTYLGSGAGEIMELGLGNTLLGYSAGKLAGANDLEKAIAIGYGAKVGCNSCAVIGGTGEDAVQVGIGINDNLNARLSLFNASNGANPHLSLIEESAGNFSRLKFENAGLAGHWLLVGRGNAAGIPRFNFFYNNESGMSANVMTLDGTFFNIGMGTTAPDAGAKLDVYGSIYLSGVFHASDRRFKKNLRNIEQPLDLIHNLRGVTYEFRTDQFQDRFADGRQYGMIAQELEQVMPELVRDREDGYKVVNYEGLIPVLIEGVKDQQDQIQKLERQVAALTRVVNRLLERESEENGSGELLLQGQNRLEQNHPNPFTENTQVNYEISPDVREAYLQITNLEGKIIGRQTITQKGKGHVVIRANSYPAGTYFYSLVVDGEILSTKKMVLTR